LIELLLALQNELAAAQQVMEKHNMLQPARRAGAAGADDDGCCACGCACGGGAGSRRADAQSSERKPKWRIEDMFSEGSMTQAQVRQIYKP
jgi:hypothetical protein